MRGGVRVRCGDGVREHGARQDGHRVPPQHPQASHHVGGRELAGRRDDQRARQRHTGGKRRWHFAGAWRRVDDQVVQFAPLGRVQQLDAEHRAADSDLVVLVHIPQPAEPAKRHEPQPTVLQREHGVAGGISLHALLAHRLRQLRRQRRAVDVSIKEPDPMATSSEAAGELEAHRRLSHAALAGGHGYQPADGRAWHPVARAAAGRRRCQTIAGGGNRGGAKPGKGNLNYFFFKPVTN